MFTPSNLRLLYSEAIADPSAEAEFGTIRTMKHGRKEVVVLDTAQNILGVLKINTKKGKAKFEPQEQGNLKPLNNTQLVARYQEITGDKDPGVVIADRPSTNGFINEVSIVSGGTIKGVLTVQPDGEARFRAFTNGASSKAARIASLQGWTKGIGQVKVQTVDEAEQEAMRARLDEERIIANLNEMEADDIAQRKVNLQITQPKKKTAIRRSSDRRGRRGIGNEEARRN